MPCRPTASHGWRSALCPWTRNERAFPRAFVVARYQVASRERVLELVRDPSLDLSATVVLEEDLPWLNGRIPAGGPSARSR